MNIFITGTSKGLGWGLAKYYLQNNHKVYGLSRTVPKDLCLHPNYQHFDADLSDVQSINNLLNTLKKSISSLDLIVLNAGILSKMDTLKNTSLADIELVMQVNVWANKSLVDFFTSNYPVKQIVGISSGAANSTSVGWNAYSLSKTTLNRLLALYAQEITTCHFSALAPGLIDTDMQTYLCTQVDEQEFPTATRLKAAKGTSAMPQPLDAGKLIAQFINTLSHYPSGSFVDIRKP